ncbi:MAG: hypothetical protein ACK49K_03770 [Bacteroidota bacterium]
MSIPDVRGEVERKSGVKISYLEVIFETKFVVFLGVEAGVFMLDLEYFL